MVQNTVHATYTETYDLNTALNEISLLGIHTPQATALKSMFKGFFENYKKYKIVGCNLGMVCASTQSLTPDQVGLTSGSVDPRDVLNPVLFKACTGENLNEILNTIYTLESGSVEGSSVIQKNDPNSRSIAAYYQFLSDDTWRKEHPQRGLFVKGLKPLVHKVVTTQPFRWTGANSSDETFDYPRIGFGTPVGADVSNVAPKVNTVGGFGGNGGFNLGTETHISANPTMPTMFISDGTTDMPWLDTTFDGTVTIGDNTVRSQRLIVSVPRVFCGVIVLPPAILQRLYFRMQIQWHVMFKDFRPAFEVGPIGEASDGESAFAGQFLGTSQASSPTYWNIYHDGSTKLDKEYSSFDVNGEAEVEQVMESVN